MFKVKWFAQLNGWSAAIDEGKKSSSRLESFYSDDTWRSAEQWIQPPEQGQDTTDTPSSFNHYSILIFPPRHALVLLNQAPITKIISYYYLFDMLLSCYIQLHYSLLSLCWDQAKTTDKWKKSWRRIYLVEAEAKQNVFWK